LELKELESAIEGILFAAGDPVSSERICATLEQDKETVDAVCQRLADQYSYERRGIRLVRLESSWQMCSAPEHAAYIRKAFENRKPARLSQPALEVLAIVAYFQPVTKAYIEQVRGVDSSYTVGLLLERDLICEAGRLAVPGRPIQYKTTKNFLRSFSLTSLDELPELPSATQEGAQMRMKLEDAIQKLQDSGEPAEEAEAAESAPETGEGV
jgi:segregation and condensation protein B